MNSGYRFIVAIVTVLISWMLSAQLMAAAASNAQTGLPSEPIKLTNESQPVEMGRLVDIVEDKGGQLALEEVRALAAEQWFKSPLGSPNFSYTPSAYWFKGKIKNTDINRLNGLLEISNPLLSDIEYYFLVDDTVQYYYVSGSLYPFEDRPVHHRNFLFPFFLEVNQTGEFYVRVVSKSSLQVPILVAPEFIFFEDDQIELIGKSAYYGMMIIIVLFNLFLFISLREPVYLFYILFVSGFALQQLSIHGFVTANIFPDHPRIQEITTLFFMPFTIFFAALFSQFFLNLKKTAPKINLVYRGYAVLAVLVTIAVFVLDFSTVGRIVAAFAVLVSISCVLLGPYLLLKGHTIARFYSVAWICLAGGTGILAMNKLGMIPRTPFTENGLLFGSVAEAILLSLALADRLNIERRQRYEAQKQALAESEHRKKAEEQLMYTALHHSVTGMPNRIYFENWFKDNIDAYKHQNFIAFGLIHLLRFHEINQTLGHSLADGLFTQIAQRINGVTNDHEEFYTLETRDGIQYKVAIIEGVYLGFAIDLTTGQNPNLAIKSLLNCLNEPIDYHSMLIDVGATGGWAIFDKDVDGPATLIRNALIAIDIGQDTSSKITQYSHAINPYSSRKLSLVGELRNALENDELELYFQPQLSLKTKAPTSMEALLRWFHPEYGAISPDEFILIAEQSGIINPLTEWVLNEALSRISQLNDEGHRLHVAINISAVNLRDTMFPNLVLKLLNRHKVDSHQLVLEVTETAMMHDPEMALSVLNDLSNLGVKLSIDDFGTGHSSLSYIKRLPVQEIKIDRSFVMGMVSSKDDNIIVKTTVNMCHDLGLEVVAEGVENQEIRGSLEQMGCDYIQGYGLSHPLPFDDLLDWLKDQK